MKKGTDLPDVMQNRCTGLSAELTVEDFQKARKALLEAHIPGPYKIYYRGEVRDALIP